MDPSLMKQMDAFKHRAMSQPTVEKRVRKAEPESKESSSSRSRPAKKPRSEESKVNKDFDYKSSGGSTSIKFAVLAKIVKHLRKKHQEADMEPLSIDEILDETNMLDLGVRQKHWLVTEALVNNPKVEVVDGDKYRFRPVLNVHDRRGLLKLLIKHDTEGLGGVLLEEVQESVPNCTKVLKNLGDQVMIIDRPIDKKSVLFYSNKDLRIPINEEVQKLWRSIAVDGVDERNIEEYLNKHKLNAMEDRKLKKAAKQKRKAGGKKWDPATAKTNNAHVGNILQDYSEKK